MKIEDLKLFHKLNEKYLLDYWLVLCVPTIFHVFSNLNFSGDFTLFLVACHFIFYFILSLDFRLPIFNAIFWLFLTCLFLGFGLRFPAERTAIWVFINLAFGLITLFFNLNFSEEKGFEKFINALIKQARDSVKFLLKGRVKTAFLSILPWKDKEVIEYGKAFDKLINDNFAYSKSKVSFCLLVFIRRYFWIVLICFFLWRLMRWFFLEVKFYANFFQEPFLNKFINILGYKLIAFWIVLSFIGLFLARTFTNKKIAAALVLLFLFLGNTEIARYARSSFEFKPYILKISPDIASNWMEVQVSGWNFRDEPFRGKVEVNGKEQQIKRWSNQKIEIIIDPIRTETGELCVLNQYQESWVRSNCLPFTHYDSARATPEEEQRFWNALKQISQ